MSNLQETKGYYMGKEWQSQGTKKDGTPFVRYRLAFKPSMQSDKSFHMTMFVPNKFPKSLQLEQLKEATCYKLLFNEDEYVNKQGVKATSRTVAGIFIPSDTPQQSNTATPKGISKPDLSNFEAFRVKYMELVEKSQIKPNAVHMLGSWMASNEKERVAELLAKCKEAVK